MFMGESGFGRQTLLNQGEPARAVAQPTPGKSQVQLGSIDTRFALLHHTGGPPDAGPPHYMRIPAPLRACKPGQSLHDSGEFLGCRRRTFICALGYITACLMDLEGEGIPSVRKRTLDRVLRRLGRAR